MKRKVSEFSYGFVLTHELVNAYGYLPTADSLVWGGKRNNDSIGAADGVKLGYPLFLQFKASEYMKRQNAGESKLLGLPYFRFALHRRTQSNQHQMLIELERKGYAVFYATPKIHEAVNLNSAFFERQIVASSLFINPGQIGELPDNSAHRVIFSAKMDDVYFGSKPQRPLDAVHGGAFTQTLRRVTSEKGAWSLNDDFFHNLAGDMVSLISPNLRIFDELTEGEIEMNAATFANYLAKTLFDCELLIVPL